MAQLIIVTILVLVAVLITAESQSESKLIFTTVLFRHGDRTPVECYPNDPYKNASFWPEGFGQLTNVGKTQHYQLGKWLRSRYESFLPLNYNNYDIYVRSTDVDRTLMSALANLAGLYPPENDEIWSPDMKTWQPIPVHTVPEAEDNVLAAQKPCPTYNSLMSKLNDSDYFRQLNAGLAVLYENLSNLTGANINTITAIEFLYDTLFIESSKNRSLPEWTVNYYPDILRHWAQFAFRIQAYNPALQRLKSGLLITEIYERMVEKKNNQLTPDRKMWIYSAHDATIANVLMSLGIFNDQPPPYASILLFELRERNDGQYGVSVFFKNSTKSDETIPMPIPGCGLFCSLDDFAEIYKHLIIHQDEWINECGLDTTLLSSFRNSVSSTVIISVAAGLLVILLLIGSILMALAYVNKNDTDNKFYFRLDGVEG